MKRRSSLRTKILTLALLPAVAMYLLVAVLSYFAAQSIAEDLVIDRDRELARLSAAELSGSLQEYPELLSGVARDLVAGGDSDAALAAALDTAANRLTYFDGGVVLLDNRGQVLASQPGQTAAAEASDAAAGGDWSAQPTFRQIIQNPNRPAFSNVIGNSLGGGEPALAVAVPVLTLRNELRGVLVGQFRVGPDVLNPFYGTLLRLRLDSKGQAYVIDGAGRVLFATDNAAGADAAQTAVAGQSLAGHPVVSPALAGGSGALRTASAGAEVLASYGPIPGTGWSLVIEEDWGTLMAPLRRYAAGLSLLLLLGILLPALVVAGGMQRITRPINALVEAARQVARGDFGRTVSAPTGDELETLAEQFNHMSAELQASYAQLEQRVVDRTRELQLVLDISRQLGAYAGEPLGERRTTNYERRGEARPPTDDRRPLPEPITDDGRRTEERRGEELRTTNYELRAEERRAEERRTTNDERRGEARPPTDDRRPLPEPITDDGRRTEERRTTNDERRAEGRWTAEPEAAGDAARAVGRPQPARGDGAPLLTLIVDRLREVVDYRFARLFVMDGETPVLLEERGEDVALAGFYYLGTAPEADELLRRGGPLLLDDTAKPSPFLDHLRRVSAETGSSAVLNGIGSILSMPLMVRDQRVGILTLVHGQRGYYTPTRVGVAMAFAAQAAVAIENARLFAAEAERIEQLRVINEVSQSIAGILDLDGLLRETAALIHDRFGYYHVGIGLVEGDEVVYRAGAGQLVSPEGEILFSPNRLRVGKDGLTGRAAATGLVLISQDVGHDRRYVPLAGLETRSELVVPIRSKEVVIGVLDIQSERLNAFDETDVDLMRALANQLAVAIENARLYEGAGQLAALEERQKLARELHDSVSQALYGIALGTRTARTVAERVTIDGDTRLKLTEPLDYVLAQADAGMAEMRALIFELRPESLQTEGLVAALRKQTAALSARHQIPVATEFGPEPELPPGQKEMLYRVAQEAMHNIVKHARATAAEVRLVSEHGRVVMEVCDNGQGFDMTQEFPGHLGLKSMRERVERGGGLLTIASAPAGGTRVMVKVSELGIKN